MNKHFSVVVCTYNRADYLAKTLESIALQEYPGNCFEVIIVDNNSSDNTKEVCDKYSSRFPILPIRYFKETQQGISFGRNKGVNEAQGEIIAFIDDDETIRPDYLEHLNKLFNQYPDAELCSGPVVPIYEATPPDWLSPYIERAVTGAYDKGNKIKTVGPNDYPGTGHATFKKELFIKYGGFNTDLGRRGSSLMGAEDKDFFLRLIQNGIKCYYLPSAEIFHHIPKEKLTDDFFERITYAIGKSERIRTLSVSRTDFFKRLVSEIIKWGGSIALFCFYLIQFQYSKGKKLLRFRFNVTKGLLGK
ncbi:MAG: glycosyltransferase [Dysgonamonadaceae bacterium]|jgi:glycosyltransferase involved in cell wall biosynthesis|nr:glycosyltransferase [Dysgonamonadaceae bacterium]